MRRLSNKEVRELNRMLGTEFSKKDVVEIGEFAGFEVVSVNGRAEFFKAGGVFVPTLARVYRKGCTLKSVTVDSGAVKFVANGADVMRPGIVRIDNGIDESEPVAVKEEKFGKVLAIGIALMDSKHMQIAEKGKCIKNIHHVGDALWNASRA